MAACLLSSGNGLPGQIITNFTPRIGSPGGTDRISLYGTGFSQGAIKVRFYNNQIAGISVGSDSEITVTNIPAGAQTGPIGIQKNGGAWNDTPQSSPFTVIGPGPFVTNFSPVIGEGNQTVTIEGVHFYNGSAARQVTSVSFNGVNGTALHIETDNRLTVKAPANVTTGPLRLTSSLGTFLTTTNGFFGPTNFSVPARVTGFTPAFGRQDTNVVISGSNFLGATAVTFDGVPALFQTPTNNTIIRAIVPAPARTGKIVVTTPAGSTDPASSNFVVLPLITGFAPNSGTSGTPVVITGQNLFGPTNVSFNGVKSTSVTGQMYGQLTATVPNGATTGPITVRTTNGTVSSAQLFYLPPRITTFAPTNGAPGTVVRIEGTNFTDASAVSFNGTPATSFVVSNNNIIGAVVPAAAITGPIAVTTPGGIAQSSGVFLGQPIIYNFSPTHGLPGVRVTVTGTNFDGISRVLFAGADGLGLAVTNSGLLGVTVPTNAQSGPLTIIGAGGTTASFLPFSVDYSSDLGVTTIVPSSVQLGSTFSYQIIVTNKGPFDAPNVTLTDTRPLSVSVNFASTTQGSLNTGGNPVTGNLGPLGVGQSATVILSVTPQVIALLTNVVSVSPGQADPNPTNNSSVAVTEIFLPSVLSVQPALGGALQFSWSAALAGYELQYNPTLSTASWSNVTSPKIMVGDRWTVTESVGSSNRFYRLMK